MPKESVAIVVDRDFGDLLIALAQRVPVWICASDRNRPEVQRVWEQDNGVGLPSKGVTIFIAPPEQTAEELFLSQLSNVDLHHPFWSMMEVYGTEPTKQITEALREYSVTLWQVTPTGFTAIRPEPPERH